MIKRLLLLAALCLPLMAQTAINDTLYLQSAAPWTGQVTVSWPAFTNCSGTAIAKGSRVYAVNAGVVSITLYATDCASPSIAYAAAYRTMGGADHGKSWSETWTVPSSPSIVTLAAVRQSSTLTARPLAHASTHASGGSDPVTPAAIGLSNVNNTSDANKPVSTAQQTALDAKAPINNPVFTGNVAMGATFLANCGGVDDTATIQAAINNAASGSTLMLPDGNCVLGNITINKKLALIGRKGATWWTQKAGTTGDWITVNAPSNGILQGVLLSGLPGNTSLALVSSGSWIYRDLDIWNGTYGIRCDSCGSSAFLNVWIYNATTAHMYVNGDNGTELNIVDLYLKRTTAGTTNAYFEYARTTTTDLGGIYARNILATNVGGTVNYGLYAHSTVPNAWFLLSLTQGGFDALNGSPGIPVYLSNMVSARFTNSWFSTGNAVSVVTISGGGKIAFTGGNITHLIDLGDVVKPGHYNFLASPFECTISGNAVNYLSGGTFITLDPAALPTRLQVSGNQIGQRPYTNNQDWLLARSSSAPTPAAGPGSNVTTWAKYRVTKIANGASGCANANGCWQVNDGTPVAADAAMNQDVTLFTLPAYGYVHCARIKSVAAATGAATITAKVGRGGDNSHYISTAYDWTAAVSGTNYAPLNQAACVSYAGTGTDITQPLNVVLGIYTTVQNVDQIATGSSIDVWVSWVQLPN